MVRQILWSVVFLVLCFSGAPAQNEDVFLAKEFSDAGDSLIFSAGDSVRTVKHDSTNAVFLHIPRNAELVIEFSTLMSIDFKSNVWLTVIFRENRKARLEEWYAKIQEVMKRDKRTDCTESGCMSVY